VTGYTYDQLLPAIVNYSGENSYPFTLETTDALTQAMPRIIEQGEGRCYRALVFLATRTQNATLSFTAGNRELDFSGITPTLMVIEGVAALTPVGSNQANGYKRTFDVTDLDSIDMLWPQPSVTYSPVTASFRYWAMKDDHTIVVCPTPDDTYKVELTGIFMPEPISATNQSTYLSTVYPELFFASLMIAVGGFLRDYGQASDDPKLAVSWEAQFEKFRDLATAEEQRRRSAGIGWTANLPTLLAQPQQS